MEELKMIIDVISKVSDDTFWVLILYFSKAILVNIIFWGGWIILFLISFKGVKKILESEQTVNKTMPACLGNPPAKWSARYMEHCKDCLLEEFCKRKED